MQNNLQVHTTRWK